MNVWFYKFVADNVNIIIWGQSTTNDSLPLVSVRVLTLTQTDFLSVSGIRISFSRVFSWGITSQNIVFWNFDF